MKYYCIFSDQSGIDGVPVFLDARIFEKKPGGDPFSAKNNAYYDWMKPGFNNHGFSDPVYLYTKNKKFSFDYYFYASHFILSDLFLQVCDKFTTDYISSKLIVLPHKTDESVEVQKEYFFVKFPYRENIIDYEESVCEFAKDDAGNPLVHNGVRYVKKYDKIVFNESGIDKDIFLIKDPVLSRNLFCSDAFRQSAGEANLYGLTFVPLDEVIDFMKYSGFLGKDTYERLKKGAANKL